MTNTVVSYADGRTKETLLNGVVKTAYEYGPNWTKIYEGPTGLASPRWSCSYEDALGRTVCETRPGFRGSLLITSNEYNTANQLVATRSYVVPVTSSPSPLTFTLICYNSLGQKNLTVSDMNLNGQIDWNDTDRIVSNDTRYVSLNGDWWRESSSWQTRQNGSSELTLMGLTRTRLTGLGDGLVSETRSIDPLGNETVACSYLDRATHTTTRTATTSASSLAAETVVQSGLTLSSRSPTGVTTAYAYDALGRQTAQTDGRGNTSQIVYDTQGRVAKTIDPLGNETTYTYDALGRQVAVTDPLGHTVTTIYDAEGRVLAQRGATYPVDYMYDSYGNKVSMTTYRNESDVPMVGGDVPGAPHAGDTTRWLYDEPSGCMTNKVYADGKGPTYDYTPDGKLARRTWARGIVTDYTYDNAGNLTRTEYDDTTPTVSLVYNRAGRQIQAIDAAGVTTFLYDDFGALTNETVVGVAGTNTIERFYDTFGRNAGYALNGIRQSALAYDPATGRLLTMQIPSEQSNKPNNQTIKQFTWTYLDGSDLKSSLSYPNGLTASWQYDANGQLLQVRNATPTNTISQYDYIYDAARRRVNVFRSGTAFDHADTISYGYNEKSELTNAVAAVDSDYRYAYDFDDIGNRETSSERGTNSVYTANKLTQYTAVDDFVSQFDDDGNQTLIKTATGIWFVTYNGENRPIRWSNGSTNIVMSFDRMGRRVAKNDLRFVYDGYLQIANFEVASTNSQLTTHNAQLFIWDPTEPVATRPLVWNRDTSSAYYTHDGNKNVSEVVVDDGEVSAHYGYAPFGAVNVVVGDCAFGNPWRFSGEYADDLLGLIYYNYRHYDPVSGRWLMRDPMNEMGGVNLYLFGCNAFVLDRLGLESGDYDGFWGYLMVEVEIRAVGAAKTLLGGAEMFAGYAFGTVTSPTLIGGIVGAAVGTHGLDVAAAGMMQFFTGEMTQTITSQVIESMGVESETANAIDLGASGMLTLGIGAANAAFEAAAGVVIVSRWGSEGLKCGGWVMKGRATFWNYFRSGKWQFGGDNQFAHPGQWNEYEVPVNSLRLPNATDEAQCGWRVIKYIKWLFGQKIYEGPPQIPIQQ